MSEFFYPDLDVYCIFAQQLSTRACERISEHREDRRTRVLVALDSQTIDAYPDISSLNTYVGDFGEDVRFIVFVSKDDEENAFIVSTDFNTTYYPFVLPFSSYNSYHELDPTPPLAIS